ncbi:MAG: signal transduction histidine kinase, LytS [Bacteroidetes bacterium]|nr:signal transduction histidine kinase, LytS [Bacteroidota bacterium]
MKWPLQKILIHSLCWIAFTLLPIIVSPDFSFFGTWEIGKPDIRNFLSSLLMILYFYANFHYFIPTYYHKKRYLLFVLITIACFILIAIFPSLLLPEQWGVPRHLPHGSHNILMPPPMEQPGMMPHQPHFQWIIPFQIESNFLKFLIIFFLSILLKVRELWIKTQNEKKATELSYLKLQVNPHFLFNTLNSIYSLALEKSDKTPSAIIKLSELMRYVTSEVNDDFVPLQKEVNYISNYIELQRIRLGETASIDFSITGTIENQKIAPLVLIPFIENAFKFGVNPEELSRIKISLVINPDQLTLSIYNKKVKLDRNVKTNGTGLKNVHQRLELIYPTSHVLTIRESDKDFTVELILQQI